MVRTYSMCCEYLNANAMASTAKEMPDAMVCKTDYFVAIFGLEQRYSEATYSTHHVWNPTASSLSGDRINDEREQHLEAAKTRPKQRG
jgi:hypothetical protein